MLAVIVIGGGGGGTEENLGLDRGNQLAQFRHGALIGATLPIRRGPIAVPRSFLSPK